MGQLRLQYWCQGMGRWSFPVLGAGSREGPNTGVSYRYIVNQLYSNNLDSIFKNRDITLPTNVHLVKAMVFTVVMYRCECCTIKKDEC